MTRYTLLQSDARLDVLERVQNVEVTDENGTRQIRDERIELAETSEEFRRIVLETVDGEEIEYLTTLKGGVPRTIQKVRTHWDRSLDSFG